LTTAWRQEVELPTVGALGEDGRKMATARMQEVGRLREIKPRCETGKLLRAYSLVLEIHESSLTEICSIGINIVIKANKKNGTHGRECVPFISLGWYIKSQAGYNYSIFKPQ